MKTRETRKQWCTAEVDGILADELAARLRIPVVFAKILLLRGLADPARIDRFLRPRLSDISDPFRMPGMPEAVDRIWRAVDSGERIAVFGDYDADGVTSTALMVKVLGSLGADVMPCLPDRMTEGYGFTVQAAERCVKALAPGLIVTVDCGSNNEETLAVLGRHGVDVVVTDHHEIRESQARPAAFVNPHRGGEVGTNGLAGVGVAFKVCHAILKAGRDRGHTLACKVDLRQYLDLVAIGTVADVVPLLGENRILVHNGIARLKQTGNTGLSTLLDGLALERGTLDSYHLGYVIGPRFNAAGRLGSPESALELLLTLDAGRAAGLAKELEDVNRQRISIERETTDRARQEAERVLDPENDRCLVIGLDNLHVGVIGLAASRLCKTYTRPSIVVSFNSDGMGKGSGRSIPGFDLAESLRACSSSLQDSGGHCAAAGLSVRREMFEDFRAMFKKVCSEKLSPADLQPVQRIDAWIELREADRDLLGALESLKPFGEGNQSPVFAARALGIVGVPRTVKESHLKMVLAQGGAQMDAIGFGMAGREIPQGPIDVAFSLVRNSYGGRETLQMELKDFRAAAADEG